MRDFLDGLFIAVLIVLAVLAVILWKEMGLIWHLAFRGAG